MARQSKARCARRQRSVKEQVRKIAKRVDSLDFFNLLTSPELLEPLERLLPQFRERLYPPTQTLAMFLGQVLSADGSCQNAVNEAIIKRMLSGLPAGSANTAAYCEARQRLPQGLASELGGQISALLNAHTAPQWLWRGRHVKLVDGTTILMPDTAANQERFPQQVQQEAGAGFPVARLVGVISLAHGAVLDLAVGACIGRGTGEHGLLRELLPCFVKGDVMVADSYYCSYFLIAALLKRGVDFLFEQHGSRNTDFRTGEKLGSSDHGVSWSKPRVRPAWMTKPEYESYPDELRVRETKVRNKVLVSSFLNPRENSRLALDRLFVQRWNVELDLRNIKETLGLGQLSCKAPSMCTKELGVYVLAYNLIRLLMAQAAAQVGVLPRQLSFKHTLQVWIAWSQRQFLASAPEDLAALFALIGRVRVGKRPGRVEPRAVKARAKRFPTLHTTRRRARRNIRLYGRPKEPRV
jgi:hypothetical protein